MKCPACAMEVPDEAIYCYHCRHYLKYEEHWGRKNQIFAIVSILGFITVGIACCLGQY